MPPRQRNSKGTNVPPTASEPVGENEEVSRQGGGIPLVEQEVVSEQRHARQEPDLMARMTAMLKDLEQEVRLLKEGRTQEVRDNIPPTGHQDGTQPEGGSAVGGRANPQYLTLADVNALLEQEREKLSGIPKQFSRDPPFPPELLGKPYPKGYEPPKFHPFDGRNGSAVEHVSRFVHTMGPYAGDRELCLREFAKSLVDRAYTWYTTLRPGSIKTWDEMMEKFCAKYYPGEDKITFQNLQMVRQRPGEDPVQFIKRFEDVSLDCYGDHEEKELVETCVANMLFDYRLNLENLCITQFADLLQRTRRTAQTMRTKRLPASQALTASVGEKRKRPDGKVFEEPPVIPCTAEELSHVLDKWIGDGVIRPFTVSRPPTEEERKNPLFCRIHNYVKHSTKDCWTLRRLFHKKLREGTLELTQKEPEVQRNPLPNHKGKGVVAVVIHGNPAEAGESEGSFHPSTVRTLQKNPKFRSLFNQLGFGPEARRVATESLMSIAADSGMECFTAESHASRAFLETTNAITFTDEDMEIEHPDHRRPLYLMATINGVQVRRALVDTGASLNLIALSTLEAVGLVDRRILGAPMEITGFGGSVESTEGYVQLALRVGPIVALTRFHVINAEVSYHVLLGRPWLHKHRLIPSTFHQCIKGRLNGRPIRIPANHNPFSQGEVNFAETMFYDELEPDDENPAPGTPGAPVLEEEEGGRGTRDLRNLLERKRQKREPSSSGSRECVVVREPEGRLIYRL